MNVTITPKVTFSGELNAQPSKAQTHRALFAGLLSKGTTKIQNPLTCIDTEATAKAVESLGAVVEHQPDTWIVNGEGIPKATTNRIECAESGVTMRFTIPIASLTRTGIKLVGEDGLMRRPLGPLIQAMHQLGVTVVASNDGVEVSGGPPEGGNVNLRGDVSSQFISGLLFAAPLMRKGLQLECTTPLESRGYVSLTIETMERHGLNVKSNDGMSSFEVKAQNYEPAAHKIPGDYSSAAFPLAAAAITNSNLVVHGLQQGNSDPDSVVVEILSKMGVKADHVSDGVRVEGGRLKGVNVDLRECPDLGPVVAVLGCFAEGETTVSGAGRLRYKESNRLKVITSQLSSLGAEIRETEDGLVARGPTSLRSGVVDPDGDHRVAMALSVAAIGAKGRVVIKDAECVSKSYPNFFNDLRSLGVEVIG